jgi:hypothetical protein
MLPLVSLDLLLDSIHVSDRVKSIYRDHAGASGECKKSVSVIAWMHCDMEGTLLLFGIGWLLGPLIWLTPGATVALIGDTPLARVSPI